MADISVTAASVATSAITRIVHGTAGATITAGKSVYYDVATGKWKLAQCDGTAAEAGGGSGGDVGIALNGAADGQPIDVFCEGDLTAGATLVVGEIYVVSATAGGIAPEADLLSTNKVTVLGVAKTAAVLAVRPIVSGAAVP